MNFKIFIGGDVNCKCFNLFNVVNVIDKFMEVVFEGVEWEFKDFYSGEVRDIVKVREFW